MIQLKETATEYLLWAPYAQKERAKSIQGYRWDGARKCWVYPHTRRVYEALIAEFGDDLGSDTLHDLITFTREAQRLTPEGIDMAHLIRKQRNIVAHSKADPHTIPARAVLCLFAAAILWPEFPDN